MLVFSAPSPYQGEGWGGVFYGFAKGLMNNGNGRKNKLSQAKNLKINLNNQLLIIHCLFFLGKCIKFNIIKKMQVEFREFDPFDLWIWLEFETAPSPMEKQYIEELFDSWFYLGKLGGFNAENLQVQDTGIEISYLDYDNDIADNVMMSPMHNMADFEYLGTWGRCWVDLGTSDLIAIDILINSLKQLSKEYVEIKKLIIGGKNKDWSADDKSDLRFANN